MNTTDPASPPSDDRWLDLTRALIAGFVSLAVLTTLAAALVTSAHRVAGPRGWSASELTSWFDRQPVGAAFRGLAAIGLFVLLYLIVTTMAMMLASLAHAARLPRLAAVAEALTVPVVRRTLAALLGLGVTLASTASTAPAHASNGPYAVARMTTVDDGSDAAAVVTMYALAPPPSRVSSPASPPFPPMPDTWTIRAGDHLWGLAAASLAASRDRAPTDAEICTYVSLVVEANRDRLAIPDHPDLVFPGQVFIRPPITPP